MNKLIGILLLFVLSICGRTQDYKKPSSVKSLSFRVSEITGIGYEEGIVRRDPSDVIKVGDEYFVWYTRVVQSDAPAHLKTSGYPGTVWYAVSKDEGRNWQEKGQSLGLGSEDAFDSFGVFTPNILFHQGKYYLYYTGVKPTSGNEKGIFENNSENDFTAIGVAVSDSPHGPFKRIPSNPILRTGKIGINGDSSSFDSYRVDDAALLVKKGKIWLYFKGRNIDFGHQGPGKTKMGVATAIVPEGPYVKQNDCLAIQHEGHEVMIWAENHIVYSLVSNVGRGIYSSLDGIRFEKSARDFSGKILAPGAYRSELTAPEKCANLSWGISMIHGPSPYLVRWEIKQNLSE